MHDGLSTYPRRFPPTPTHPLAHTPAVDWYTGSSTQGHHVRTVLLHTQHHANTNAPTHARTHSRLIPQVIAHERRCYTRHTTHAAPAALGPLRATAHTRRLFPYPWPHKPPPPPAVASPQARCALFLFRIPTLFSTGRFFILLAARCAASACQHTGARSSLRHVGIAPRCATPRLRAHARTHACTVDRRRTTRRAVRRRG